MPLDAGAVRSAQGNNEIQRSMRRQPVSGGNGPMPKRPHGVRWVANASFDTRTALQLATACLLAGQTVASTAARTMERPQSVHNPTPLRFLPDLVGEAARPLVTLAEAELTAEAQASEGAGALLWQGIAAWFARPCTDIDQYVNGFWKLEHPVGQTVPTFFTDARARGDVDIAERLQALLPAVPGVQGALAAAWSSARSADGRDWSSFQSRRDEIDALSSVDDVSAHLCMGMRQGRESVLGLRRLFHAGVLDAGIALQPDHRDVVYQVAADHAEHVAYLKHVHDLLTESGMPSAAATRAAPTILAMETVLAEAEDELVLCTLEAGIARVPGFPWQEAWAALGLDDTVALYVNPSACAKVAWLLLQHRLADWKVFLWYQHARRAAFHLRGDGSMQDALQRLDAAPGGQLALSAWYAGAFDATLRARAMTIFDGVRSQLQADVASSALPPADKALLSAGLASSTLCLDGSGAGANWTALTTSKDLLANIQALDARAIDEDLRILRDSPVADGAETPAHRFGLVNHVIDHQVRLSPALLSAVAQGGDRRPEALWGTLGVMLGHELAHTLAETRGLSAQGAALLALENQAIAQRIGDMWSSGVRMDAASVVEEAACDLRGLSAARRAAEQEAVAAGLQFDGEAFFSANARLHAAHPTAGQLRVQVAAGGHPPGTFRAGFARHVRGFDAAFGCSARPTEPFDRMFSLALPAAPATTPGVLSPSSTSPGPASPTRADGSDGAG